jgi:UrcA family protein
VLKTVLAGVGLASIALAAAVTVHAGLYDDSAPHSLAVSYAAFDLTTPQGVALLEHRIDEAVDRVCGNGPAHGVHDGEQCRRDARAGVRPQMARAIAQARFMRDRDDWATRHGQPGYGPRSWHTKGAVPESEPRRFVPTPRARDTDDGSRAPLARERPNFVPPPISRPTTGGVLGGPIDERIGRAFQTGETVSWHDHGWHGVVQVSVAREIGRSICRTVAILRPIDGAWQVLREGPVCLRPDGMLHNGD